MYCNPHPREDYNLRVLQQMGTKDIMTHTQESTIACVYCGKWAPDVLYPHPREYYSLFVLQEMGANYTVTHTQERTLT